MGITTKLQTHHLGDCIVHLLPVNSQGVVSIAGSFHLPRRGGIADDVVRDLLIGLLDKGTAKRDRFQISEDLDRAGAERDYSISEDRLKFRGRCVSSAVDNLIDTTFEELTSAAPAEEQLNVLQSRYDYAILRSMESTGAMATEQLSRMLYDAEHPNYDFLPTTRRLAYSSVDLDDILDLRDSLDLGRNLEIVVVGAYSESKLLNAIRRNLKLLERTAHRDQKDIDSEEIISEGCASNGVAGLRYYPMKDKQNLDVAMGFRLPILRADADFVPLSIANYILGGNFSSRLMQIVRDEKGLTYGIRSQLSGISTAHTGHWQTAVTLSAESLDSGMDATRAVVSDFFSGGASAGEVAGRKKTVRGNYSTRVSSTSTLAGSILNGVHLGFGPHYPDDYRTAIDATTETQVNDSIDKYLRPGVLVTSVAGTLSEATAEALAQA